MVDLSIVMICKNQEWNIARLIESVLDETVDYKFLEIVLVDSASDDRTIEIASHYPINIIRLQPDQRLTAAAGRYVGYQQTSGELILFLDGDMKLCEEWLPKAIAIMQNQPNVAVVGGNLIETSIPDYPEALLTMDPTSISDSATDELHVGGAAIYRRSVLTKVGTFNPYLYSDEEPELCLRIRQSGYRILKLEHPIALHISDSSENFSNLLARWKRNLYMGEGQNIRYLLGTKLLWPYIKERGYWIMPGVGLLSGGVSLIWSLNSSKWRWFGFWLTLVGVIIVVDMLRKKSLFLTCAGLFQRILMFFGMIRGLMLRSLDLNKTPIRYEIIK